ncbi:TPA: hypothetical protein HA265_04950, partial [Candidatus Woesearchaeota archaeon]|nr:hypothetical protein [Candidatus Woesearchaeota archaeon]
PALHQDAAKSLNEVQFEVTMAGVPMQCRPTGVLKLKEASAKGVVCTIDVEKNRGAYITPIVVKTKYRVLQQAIQEMRIQPPPEGGKAVDCQKTQLAGGVPGQAQAVTP